MKLKYLAVTLAALGGSAIAAFSPQQLLQLTRKPMSIKPVDTGSGNVNSGVVAVYWEWGDPLKQGAKLTRLNGNLAAWQFDLSTRAYALAKLAPQRQLLATITDPIGNIPADLYLIKSGVFKGQYAIQQRFSDGGRSLSIVSKAYATSAAQGSELQQGGESQIYSYPLGTFLLYKAAFCSISGAVCK